MKELEKISDDPKTVKKTGCYKDKEGYYLHSIFQSDYIKTQDILFISNGVLLTKYKSYLTIHLAIRMMLTRQMT